MSSTDCFVKSQLFNLARLARRFKPISACRKVSLDPGLKCLACLAILKCYDATNHLFLDENIY